MRIHREMTFRKERLASFARILGFLPFHRRLGPLRLRIGCELDSREVLQQLDEHVRLIGRHQQRVVKRLPLHLQLRYMQTER